MKILVTYFSLSGNTKKIAQAISDEIVSNGHEGVLESLAEINPDSFNRYDLVFLGSACHDADLAEPVKNLLENIARSPTFKLAGFVTHSASMPEGDQRKEELYEQWAGRCLETFERISREKGIDFLGYFHCQGVPSPPIAEFIHREIIPDKDEWEEHYAEVVQHPNDDDLAKAQLFTRKILTGLTN